MTSKHRIGATFSTAIEIMDGGTVADVQSVVAVFRRVKKTSDGEGFVFSTVDDPIIATVSARPADALMGEGWNIILSAAQTAALSPGYYALDAKFTMADSVVITEISSLYEMTEGAVT